MTSIEPGRSPREGRPTRQSRPARPLVGLVLALLLAVLGATTISACGGEEPATDKQSKPKEQAGKVENRLPPRPEATEEAEQSEDYIDPSESEARTRKGLYTLRIQRIGVNAPVVSIKSNDDRVLVPPRDPGLAGWWNGGAAPGADTGSAIIVGHTVRAGGGVFDEIGNLATGDTIELEGDGAALTYRVESVRSMTVEQVAGNAEQIFDQSVPGRLVLVTCEDWDGEAWRSNTITIAVPA